MPPEKYLEKNMKELETLWRKHENKILKEISKVLGLPWNEKQINVYITSGAGWFSKPLTLSFDKNNKRITPEWAMHVLTHELIHRIWSEKANWSNLQPRWKKFMKKYSKEVLSTRVHIPVHAVHKHIFLNIFSEKELKKEMDDVRTHKAYARSWELVERDGYREIIKALNPRYR